MYNWLYRIPDPNPIRPRHTKGDLVHLQEQEYVQSVGWHHTVWFNLISVAALRWFCVRSRNNKNIWFPGSSWAERLHYGGQGLHYWRSMRGAQGLSEHSTIYTERKTVDWSRVSGHKTYSITSCARRTCHWTNKELSYPGLYSLYTVWYCRPVVCCLQYTCWFSSTLDQLNIRHYVETPLCLWHLSLSRFSACVIFLPLWFDLPLWFYCLRKRLFFAIVTLYSLWCAFSELLKKIAVEIFVNFRNDCNRLSAVLRYLLGVRYTRNMSAPHVNCTLNAL